MFQGFAINLLRDALQQKRDVNEKSREKFPNIVWSVYDRIDVRATNSLQEFFDCSFNPNFWIGEIQSLYLFPFQSDISNFADIRIQKGRDSLFSGRQLDRQSEKYTFFSIVTVDVSEEIEKQANSVPYALINSVCDRLFDYTSQKEVVFDAFQSLGTEDVVFIFLGNKISDIIKSVHFLRSLQIQTKEKKINFCATTYSLLGLNSNPKNVKFVEDQEAIAQVSITLKDGKRADEFLEKFPLDPEKLENSIEILIGEYDVQFTCKATGDFLKLYQHKGALTAQTDLYNEYILQSKTVWYIKDIEKVENEIISFNISQAKIQDSKNNPAIEMLKARVKTLTQKLSEEKSHQGGTKPNINIIAIYQDVILFVNEFIKIMSSCSHVEWFKRLENIAYAFDSGIESFFETLDSESNFVELEHRGLEQKITEINEVLTACRNALSHMHKSGEHFYNVPHPSIYYSGSAHKILMAYYNFIDLVLSLGYLKPHAENTSQSRISFFITFEMINKVQTKIYFKTSAKEENRLVGFELPYAALYDFKKYIPALLHEVYHLIAPVNRAERNQKILYIWMHSNICNYILKYLMHLDLITKDKSFRGESSENLLEDIALKYLIDKEEDVISLLSDNLERYGKGHLVSLDNSVMNLDQVDFVQVFYKFNEDRTYNEFIESVLLGFCEYLSKGRIYKYLRQRKVNEEVVTHVKKMVRRSRDTENNISIIKSIAKERNSRTWEEKYNNAIKETICDTFFVDVLRWSMQDYLAYMLDVFNDNQVDWSSSFYQEISVRIGTIILYFFGGEQNRSDQMKRETVQEWFEEQLERSSFSDADKIYVWKIFSTFLSSYKWSARYLLSIAKAETISCAIQNIESKEQKKLFIRIALEIKNLYEIFSGSNSKSNSKSDLCHQVWGILFLQSDFSSKPQNIELPRQISSQRAFIPQHLQRLYYVPERTISGDLGQFLSVVSEFQNLVNPEEQNGNKKAKTKQKGEVDKKEPNREEFWYRGVCNSTYDLIPSLFRNLPESSCAQQGKKQEFGKRRLMVPYGYQVAMIRQAYMQTKTYYSLLEKNEMPLAVRQAFFQHYGVQTNFLDFSTNPLSALYWALYPDDESDRKKVSEAAVYVFSPKKYQAAVNTIRVYHKLLQEEDAAYLYPYHTQHCLPDEYVVENMSDNHVLQLKEKAQTFQEQVGGENAQKYKEMPIATVVPQKNDRILAQSGCFVAYSLLCAEDYFTNKDNPFAYLTLEEIQKEYVRICEIEKKSPERFLFKILVPIIYQEELRSALSTIFNYSLSKVYPDVDKLLKEARGGVEAYFKKDT